MVAPVAEEKSVLSVLPIVTKDATIAKHIIPVDAEEKKVVSVLPTIPTTLTHAPIVPVLNQADAAIKYTIPTTFQSGIIPMMDKDNKLVVPFAHHGVVPSMYSYPSWFNTQAISTIPSVYSWPFTAPWINPMVNPMMAVEDDRVQPEDGTRVKREAEPEADPTVAFMNQASIVPQVTPISYNAWNTLITTFANQDIVNQPWMRQPITTMYANQAWSSPLIWNQQQIRKPVVTYTTPISGVNQVVLPQQATFFPQQATFFPQQSTMTVPVVNSFIKEDPTTFPKLEQVVDTQTQEVVSTR